LKINLPLQLLTSQTEDQTVRNKRGVPGPASDQLAGRRRVLENRLMNRCFCVWVGSILATISLAGSFTRIASGQAAPAAPVVTIPPQALNATSETPYAADFKKFIDTELADLTGTRVGARKHSSLLQHICQRLDNRIAGDHRQESAAGGSAEHRHRYVYACR
jgi:hypothetical protein